jgi:hypothetical protein
MGRRGLNGYYTYDAWIGCWKNVETLTGETIVMMIHVTLLGDSGYKEY